MLRVRVELDAHGGVVAVDGLQKADHTRRDQVVEVEMLWKPAVDAPRDDDHLRHVLHDELIALRDVVRAAEEILFHAGVCGHCPYGAEFKLMGNSRASARAIFALSAGARSSGM